MKQTISYIICSLFSLTLLCCTDSGTTKETSSEDANKQDSIAAHSDAIQASDNHMANEASTKSDEIDDHNTTKEIPKVDSIYENPGEPAENMEPLKNPSIVIKAKTLEEFINSITDNVTIIVSIDDDAKELRDEDGEDDGDNDRLINISKILNDLPYFEDGKGMGPGIYNYGGGLLLNELTNVTIQGESENPESTSIVIEESYTDVIWTRKCTNIKFQNLKIGHMYGPHCLGDALSIDSCNNIEITNCKLYGCGYIGLSISNSQNINVSKTEIYECSSEALFIHKSKNVLLNECLLRDCPDGIFTGKENQQIELRDCYISSNVAKFRGNGPLKVSGFHWYGR